VENAAPDCGGGKCGSNEYGKPKFPLFNIVTSDLQQPIQDAQLSQRDRAAGCVIVFAKKWQKVEVWNWKTIFYGD